MEDFNFLNSITIIGLTLVVIILLLLIFRSVLLWFWKINTQVDLLMKNNQILDKILVELKKNSTEKDFFESRNSIRNENLEKSTENSYNPDTEKTEVIFKNEIKKMIENLKSDEIIIEDKKTKKISIIKKSKYEIDKELHLSHNYNLIYKND
jgi:hypothetical protein